MTERWRRIPGYSMYEASDAGRIRSYALSRPRILQGHVSRGYVKVKLISDAGKTYEHFAHRLVLLTFVGPSPAGMECRHLNGKSQDNRLDNLRWGTPTENQMDRIRHGTHPLAAKTKCPKGHPYDETNTLYRGGARNRRLCRECNRAAYRRWYHAQKAKAAMPLHQEAS